MAAALALIAAVARNGIIGAGNALPWRLPTDMRHFKATTMGRPMLMGRKTWQSIGRPLPGRTVIVVSGDPAFTADGVEIARTLEAALDRAQAIALATGADTVMVAGGGVLYRALIGAATRLYITEVAATPEGDTCFPAIDPALWRLAARETPPRDPRDEAAMAFARYERL